MFHYNILIQYSFSAFAAILCLLPLMLRSKSALKSKVYTATAAFVINIMAISIILCVMFLQEVFSCKYLVNTLWRSLDYILYAGLLFTWTNLLEKLSHEASANVTDSVFIPGKIFSAIGIIIFGTISIFFMDNAYYISNETIQGIYPVTEIIFALIASFCIWASSMHACSIIAISSTKKYIVCMSICLSIYFISQIWMTNGLGIDESPVWVSGVPDFSGWFLFAMNCLAIYFVFKKDFQVLFVESSNASDLIDAIGSPDSLNSDENDIAKTLDKVAADHRLTVREREIIEHLYSGKTNAVIASELYISQNTVKTHVKNIYEKLGVSSRMELSYLINTNKSSN